MAPTLRPLRPAPPKCRKIKFTELEDQKILSLVGSDEASVNWEFVSLIIGTRSPRQCKDRFHAYLAPGLNKSEWSTQEDQKLLDLVELLGQKWKSIATSFVGRPEVSLKNRYRLLMRRLKRTNEGVEATEEKKIDDLNEQLPHCDDFFFGTFDEDPYQIDFFE